MKVSPLSSCSLEIVEMSQDAGRETIGEMMAGIEVELIHQVGIEVSIGMHTVNALRLEELDVDLARRALVAIAYARSTLAHLNALHPGTWDKG